MVAAGTLPFLAGALLPMDAHGPVLCPFRALTGWPCPLCGATRAFVHAGHLDGAFVSYGAVWVAAAVALVVAGLAQRRVPPWSIVPVGLVAWAWALAHAGTIT